MSKGSLRIYILYHLSLHPVNLQGHSGLIFYHLVWKYIQILVRYAILQKYVLAFPKNQEISS